MVNLYDFLECLEEGTMVHIKDTYNKDSAIITEGYADSNEIWDDLLDSGFGPDSEVFRIYLHGDHLDIII